MGDGNPYELLTQEVFQALLDRSELRGVEVQHNVILEGKDTPTHQIDVFWTFDVAGIQYQNVTQADENGDESGTVLAVYKGFVDQIIGKEGERHKLSHQFDKPTFLHTSDRDLPSLNIQSITSTVTIKKKRRMERPFRLPNVTLCVLRNVSDGTVWLVGKRTTPSEIEAESRSASSE